MGMEMLAVVAAVEVLDNFRVKLYRDQLNYNCRWWRIKWFYSNTWKCISI